MTTSAAKTDSKKGEVTTTTTGEWTGAMTTSAAKTDSKRGEVTTTTTTGE